MPATAHGETAHTGPVSFTGNSRFALYPVTGSRIIGGFWHERRRINAEVGVPQGPRLLASAGNLHNLRLAAGTTTGEYRGDLPFLDTDVYKWLEAACWQLGECPDGELAAQVDEMIALLAAAQEPSGYVNSWFQVTAPGRRFEDLRWGHELYCAGHLIQAGVAHHRTTGRTELLTVAIRFADHVNDTFGPGKAVDGVCGHPVIETALVELHRETGERRYLELARWFVDRRGHGLLNEGEGRGTAPGPAYCQDRVPVREAADVEGHAVRQLYLLAGVTDVAAETGDPELRAAVERLWSAMTASKTHLTGGLGARHEWEDFGDPFELPNERAYCETCAAVASVQWSWRMALLTGDARYSDLIERTLYNGLLAGVSLDGESWLYVNPLQVRDGYTDEGSDQTSRRVRWFRCACCPPNVMRLLTSLPHYFASADQDGVQLHQYADGRYSTAVGGRPVEIGTSTDYPWQGEVAVTVESSPDAIPWTLSLRIPQWCGSFTATVAGAPVVGRAEGGWLRVRRVWRPGETVRLSLGLEARLTAGDPRADAIRGCVAVERGPLVYCLEQTDNPGGGLDGIVLDRAAPLTVKHRPDLLGGVTTVLATGSRRDLTGRPGWWPYTAAGANTVPAASPLELTAIPYYTWANRGHGSMRVWLPTV